MESPWRFLFRGGNSSVACPSATKPAGEVLKSSGSDALVASYAPMQHLGEQNELLHVRFGYMADRLEELKSLSEDFSLLTKPIADMAMELPKAKARILECEALLQREIQEGRAAKEELHSLRQRFAAVSEERNEVGKRSAAYERALTKAEEASSQLHIQIEEAQSLIKAFEKRLQLENESREHREAELVALAAELAQKSDSYQALIADMSRERERADQLESEVNRLEKVADHQVLQIVTHQNKVHEIEKTSREHLQTIDELRGRSESERSNYNATLHAQELVVSSLSAEKASLILRVDQLQARAHSSDQTVVQLRAVLAERTCALQTAEDLLRASAKESHVRERQILVLEQQAQDHSVRISDLKRASEDAHGRAAMMTKALSAKNAALDAALDQAHARAEQIVELNQRLENERSSLTAANRLLVEDLENERAERTLAQGALKIARESRSSLQRQNEALKRANRSLRNASSDSPHHPTSDVERQVGYTDGDDVLVEDISASNVSHFPVKSKDTVETI